MMQNSEWDVLIERLMGAERDRERLQRADMAIDVARGELEGLENACEDLNYLIEIVQVGLKRALKAAGDDGALVVKRAAGPGHPN